MNKIKGVSCHYLAGYTFFVNAAKDGYKPVKMQSSKNDYKLFKI